MGSVRGDVAQARVEIKEINTGITARLLNLESNAINKIEFNDHEARIRSLETQRWVIAGAVATASTLAGFILSIIF
jgi:hypothetical protein